MAKKDQNEEPEEEKNEQFDDEDFGLPDLEYDELEEEADGALSDEEDGEEDEEPEPEVISEEPSEDAVESEITDGDDSWEQELEEEIEQDMQSGKFDESAEAFYEEESFEEFEEDAAGQESVGSSVFGIDESEQPDVEVPQETEADTYSEPDPSPASQEETKTFEPQYSQYLDDGNKSKGKFVRTVVLGTILILIVGSVFAWMYWNTDGSEEGKKEIAKTEKKVEKKEEPKKEPESKPEEPAKEPKKTEPKPEAKKVQPKPKQATANTVAAGEIQTLDQQTGKTYIIIASFFDDDIAMDHAKELSAQGKSPYIIPPFKDHRFYRVAIAEFNSFEDARSNLETYKAEYGADIWPLRY